MTNSDDRRPFSMPYVTTTNFVSGAMIARAPWPSPVNKYFVIRKLVATVNNGANVSGGILNIWDQDLSNTTPAGRGSGGGPLLSVPLAANTSGAGNLATMTILDIDACPQQYFQAGVTAGTTGVSGFTITVTAEFDVV